MVIPIPSGGAGGLNTPLTGTPPEGRVRQLVFVVRMLVICIVLSFLSSIMLGIPVAKQLINLSNYLINVIIGIFLLREFDETMGKAHKFMLDTCCRNCQDNPQCHGGMAPCLMTFIFINGISVVFSLIFGSADIGYVLHPDAVISDPASWPNSLWGFGFLMFAFSTIGIYLAQIMGVYFAYKAKSEWSDLASGVEARPGSWSSEPVSGGGGRSLGGGGGGGGGFFGGAPSAPPAASTGSVGMSGNQGFQAFGGQGQRLGS